MCGTATHRWILFIAPTWSTLTCYKLYWTIQMLITHNDPAALVLVGGQDSRAFHGSSRSAVHPSAFVLNGLRLVVVATPGWRNRPLLSTRSDDDDEDPAAIEPKPDIRRESRFFHNHLYSTPPLILIVLSKLERDIQSPTDMLHTVITAAPLAHICWISVVLMHLFITVSTQ